jgi:hypothetical protein
MGRIDGNIGRHDRNGMGVPLRAPQYSLADCDALVLASIACEPPGASYRKYQHVRAICEMDTPL